MQGQRRKYIAIAGFLIVGTMLGAGSGFLLGNYLLERTSRTSLADYAADLIQQSDRYAAELSHVATTFNPSRFAFCSPEEILEMKTMAFRSRLIEDIGRTREGRLFCSGGVGQLPKPMPLPPVTLVSPRGVRVYGNAPVITSPADRAVLLEYRGVEVMISPVAYEHWARPQQGYSVVITNPASSQMVRIAGENLGLTPAEVLAKTEIQRSDIYYYSRCSAISTVCVITSKSADDMWSNSSPIVWGSTAMGALVGLAMAIAVTLLFVQRLGLAYQLRVAIRRGGLQVVYQPIIDLATRRCVGAEALLRWSDRDGKPVAPDFFVRIAEERGFIRELTAFVVRRATLETRHLLLRYPEFTLSINIAAADLVGECLFSLLDNHFQQTGIAAGQIALELTERSTGDLPVVQEAILRLHRYGYKVHIDDFGTGFSSLSYLHQLAVDAIKVDRAFTRTIGTDAVTASILPQILSLAQNLQLGVIVEGVETQAQITYLESTRCSMQVQGYFFSTPQGTDALEELLAAQKPELLAGPQPGKQWIA